MKIIQNTLLVLVLLAELCSLHSMEPSRKKQKSNDGSALVVARPTSQTVLLNASLPAHLKTYYQNKAETELIARCSAELPQEIQEKIAQYALAGNPVLLRILSQITVPHQEIKAHRKSVLGLAFSNNGTLLASCSQSGLIKLWNAQTGAGIRSFGQQGSSVLEIAFNNDSTVLFSAGDDKKVRLWDVVSGNCIKVLDNFSSVGLCLAVSRDSKDYLAVGHAAIVDIFDQQGGRICTIPIQDTTGSRVSDSFIQDMRFSPDGTKLYAASCKAVHVIDLETRRHDQSFTLLPNQAVWKIDVQGNQLVVGFSKGAVGIWDLKTQNLLRLYQSTENLIISNVISHQTNFLISTSATREDDSVLSSDMMTMVWSVHHGNRIWTGKEHQESPIWSLAVTTDMKRIATGAQDGKVMIRDMASVLQADQDVKRFTIDQALLTMAAIKRFGIPRGPHSQAVLLNSGSPLINPRNPFVMDDTLMLTWRTFSPALQQQLCPLLDFRMISNVESNNNNNNNAT